MLSEVDEEMRSIFSRSIGSGMMFQTLENSEQPSRVVSLLRIGLLALVALNAVLSTLFFALDPDSGVFLTIARGILDGKLPYADFFDHKPPAIYLTLTLPLLLGGESIWVAKLFLLGSLALIVCLTWLLAGAVGLSKDAKQWAIVLFLSSWILFQGYTLRTEVFVTLCVTSSALLAIRRRWSLAAVCLGFAVLYKQTAVLFVLPFAWYAWMWHKGAALKVVVGSLVVAATGIGLAGAILGFDKVLHQVILSNFGYVTESPVSLRDRVKSLYDLAYSVPLWMLALGSLYYSRHLERRLIGYLMIVALLPAVVFPTSYYLMPSTPFAALLAGSILQEFTSSVRAKWLPFIVAAAIAPLVLFSTQPSAAAFSRLYILHQIQAGQTIKNLTTEDEPILMIAAAPQYYFLSGRYPPLENLYLLAVNHSEKHEMEAIQQIKGGKVRLVGIQNHKFTDMYANRVKHYVEQHCSEHSFFQVLDLRLYLCSPDVRR